MKKKINIKSIEITPEAIDALKQKASNPNTELNLGLLITIKPERKK